MSIAIEIEIDLCHVRLLNLPRDFQRGLDIF
jgi:hypothetical protein